MKKTHLDPVLLLLRDHVFLHHLGLDGHAREALETEPALAGHGFLGLCKGPGQASWFVTGGERTYHDGFNKQRGLDAHTEVVLLVFERTSVSAFC